MEFSQKKRNQFKLERMFHCEEQNRASLKGIQKIRTIPSSKIRKIKEEISEKEKTLEQKFKLLPIICLLVRNDAFLHII